MTLNRTDRQSIVDAALRDRNPWQGEGLDNRTITDLEQEEWRKHLGQIVYSYRKNRAIAALVDFDPTAVD